MRQTNPPQPTANIVIRVWFHVVFGCLLIACNAKEDPNAFRKGTTMAELKARSAQIAAKQAQEEARQSPPPLRVRPTDLQGNWPLTIEEAEIVCSGNRILLRSDGKLYALNGTAQGTAAANGWLDIDSIWKFQKKGEPYRVSMGSMIGLAVKHCKI